MMIGNWRWNAVCALVVALITFMLSVFNNILMTTLTRTLYSFIIIFVFVYIFRWIIGTIAGLKPLIDEQADEDSQSTIDLSTPEETESMKQMLKDSLQNHSLSEEQSFSPINPPRLVSTKVPETQQMAQAVRHMLEDEGR